MTPDRTYRVRDIVERIVWTAVAAAISSLLAVPVLGIEVWRAAALTAATSIATSILVIARWRLSILPDPGAGLPGIHPDHTGPWTKDHDR